MIGKRASVSFLDMGAGMIDQMHMVRRTDMLCHATTGQDRQRSIWVTISPGRRDSRPQHVLDQVDAAARGLSSSLPKRSHKVRRSSGASRNARICWDLSVPPHADRRELLGGGNGSPSGRAAPSWAKAAGTIRPGFKIFFRIEFGFSPCRQGGERAGGCGSNRISARWTAVARTSPLTWPPYFTQSGVPARLPGHLPPWRKPDQPALPVIKASTAACIHQRHDDHVVAIPGGMEIRHTGMCTAAQTRRGSQSPSSAPQARRASASATCRIGPAPETPQQLDR